MAHNPDDFPTPGQYIRALLAEREWDQRTLAHVLGLDYGSTNRLVLDKRPVDAFSSIMLAEVFGGEADDFLRLQRKFDLAVARASTRPDKNRALRAALFGNLPVAEMIKRGWLKADLKNIQQVETELMRFFGVPSLELVPTIPAAAKKATAGGEMTPKQNAWVRRVVEIAATLQTPRYSPDSVRAAIAKLGGLLGAVEGVTQAGPILAKAGVRLVVVDPLKGSKIDGVCTWLNDMAPVIGLSLRHDRIDNFWFVLRHELEHVLRGHGRKSAKIDVDIGAKRENVSEEERVADAAALEFCVPQDQMDRFYDKKHPFFMEVDVVGFAATLKVHPGLVVGQLQHRAGRFDRFRDYLAKVWELVTPTVATDGWGDPYPLAVETVRPG
ncbi:MAG TPA: ImmA/IrrE family metallo-endopeptidase [Gemmatimonadaceae bacterium]